MRSTILALALVATLIAASNSPGTRIERQVRMELVMLPFYDVFDHLAFSVDGSKVTLFGAVTRASLKADAERSLKRVEGVESIDNRIQVLPPSRQDDAIRLAVFRALYGHPALTRYAIRAVPSIHIIVSSGRVTLEGVVANEPDKNIANIEANSVPGVFSVTNNLQVEKRPS